MNLSITLHKTDNFDLLENRLQHTIIVKSTTVVSYGKIIMKSLGIALLLLYMMHHHTKRDHEHNMDYELHEISSEKHFVFQNVPFIAITAQLLG